MTDLQWPPPRGAQTLLVPGEAGAIEVMLSSPPEPCTPRTGMLICHPHPLYGGAMTNKVVHSLAMAAHDAGVHALRFNFRGVGRSEGVHDAGRGEVDDVLQLAALMRGPLACQRLLLAGFSFGGFVAVAAQAALQPDALITIAPALRYLGPALPGWPACPWLVVHGTDDDVVPHADSTRMLAGAPDTVQLLSPSATGHFFHGRLDEVREPVRAFIEGLQSHE